MRFRSIASRNSGKQKGDGEMRPPPVIEKSYVDFIDWRPGAAGA